MFGTLQLCPIPVGEPMQASFSTVKTGVVPAGGSSTRKGSSSQSSFVQTGGTESLFRSAQTKVRDALHQFPVIDGSIDRLQEDVDFPSLMEILRSVSARVDYQRALDELRGALKKGGELNLKTWEDRLMKALTDPADYAAAQLSVASAIARARDEMRTAWRAFMKSPNEGNSLRLRETIRDLLAALPPEKRQGISVFKSENSDTLLHLLPTNSGHVLQELTAFEQKHPTNLWFPSDRTMEFPRATCSDERYPLHALVKELIGRSQ